MQSAFSCSSMFTGYDDAARRDEELVAAWRTGSGEAFQEIQKLYSPRLYKRLLSITKNREDAEDALQDTFLRAFVAINSFEGRSQFSTWLTRIAINSALGTIRRRRTRGEVSCQQTSESGEDISPMEIRDTALNPEETCDLRQRHDSMLHAISRLDAKSKAVLGIWIAHECSMKEIARIMDVPLATVKSRLNRARRRLVKFVLPEHRARRLPLTHSRTFAFKPQNREESCLSNE
jgi:RNA polymerase sigma-70 factor, ECF subfamily